MPSRNEYRFTIGQFLIFIVACSVVLVVVLDRRTLNIVAEMAVIGIMIGIIGLFAFGAVEGYTGRTCPGCGEDRMRRVALSTFGLRYFRCNRCKARWKRGILNPWESTNSPEEAVLFARKVAEDPWTLPPGLSDEDEVVWSKTHTSLLRNKQRRNPDAPLQEKLPPID